MQGQTPVFARRGQYLPGEGWVERNPTDIELVTRRGEAFAC
mgnify:CR=1 FL=1